MEGRLQVLAGNSNRPLAQAICHHLSIDLGQAYVGTFKNGETRIHIEENVRGSDVFIVQAMNEPVDHNLVELLLMIDAVRRASARRITAVIPYYGYAKQEKKTVGREPISAKLVANLLTTAGANRILTLDLHTPAIEGFFDIPVDHLRASSILTSYFQALQLERPVVVSPDAGGVGRANDFRSRLGASLAIISKQHPEIDRTKVLEMVGDVDGRTTILVDDMISTGGTIVEAVRALKERGAREVYVCATHGIFADNALALLQEVDPREVIVTDTIPARPDYPNLVKVLTIAPLVAESIIRIHKDLSLSKLFV